MSTEDQSGSTPTEGLAEDSIILYGQSLVDRVTYVPSTYTSLLMCMGKVTQNGPDVLVPLVDVRLDGPIVDDTTRSTLFYQLMTIENLAFVLEDVTSDLTAVCQQLGAVSSGRAKPDILRLSAMKAYLSQAKANLEKCLSEIEPIA
ncbi:hypothetical protein [Bradyrhizobium sp. CCBAU 53421]|uniref:hypothetical protein n=1 Tax=Bradyrhizobium sp. CCBAU 53421 TaxID=1325120 RepID=UPI00188A1A1C|nr:hypothetical protein [Bradyrhizobium sp. CCBAU 53421]QOZ36340.1 hypothetical protein XH92_35705 [Bradyrhizobium sp. CCBAU 53421]